MRPSVAGSRREGGPTCWPRLVRVLGIGMGEALFLLVIGLVVMGPEKLPRIAADVVRTIRAIRRVAADARDEVRESLEPELRGLGLDLDERDDADRPRARESPRYVAGQRPPYDADAT